jgi:molecular chaperone Hsp33
MADNNNRLMGFTIASRSARGRLVRLGSVLDEVLGAHAYPEPVARLLAETLALTALLGALFRPEDGQLTLQAKGKGGPISLMVADFRDWALRGYAALDLDRRFPAQGDGSLESLFGNGQLVLTLDQTSSAERYQGIVELGSTSLQAAAQKYFENSEQLPTIVRLAARQQADGRWTAGGLIVQQLARSEEGGMRLHVEGANPDWEHVAVLGGSVTEDELTDLDLSEESLLWRLFNEEEVRVLPAETLKRGCRCSVEHIRNVLEQFPEEERAEMRNADGVISVDCEFCSKQFLLEV